MENLQELLEYPEYLADAKGNLFSKDLNRFLPRKTAAKGGPYYDFKCGGKRVKLAESKLISLVSKPEPPHGFFKVPGYKKVHISKEGSVWIAPGKTTPLGTFASIYISSDGYPAVRAETGTRYLHVLLALTFIDSEYLKKGLCVMHLDDNKLNFKLNNLKVSTYSENNKAAYDTGVNPSKKQ